jgi:hypothetical protein
MEKIGLRKLVNRVRTDIFHFATVRTYNIMTEIKS